MGTRHLIIVKEDGKTKVAQYGQWDGYPSEKGKNTLIALKMMNLDRLREQLKKTHFLSQSEIDKLWREAGADASGMISLDKSETFCKAHPELHRDTSYQVLKIIYRLKKNATLGLQNAIRFKGAFDCEWAYEIDLTKNTFTVLKDGTKKVAEYKLDALPSVTTFIRDSKKYYPND